MDSGCIGRLQPNCNRLTRRDVPTTAFAHLLAVNHAPRNLAYDRYVLASPNPPANDAIKALAIGFGRWARRRTLAPALQSGAIDVAVVTGLEYGITEFEANVEPLFQQLKLPVPRYVDDIGLAMGVAGEAGCILATIHTPSRRHVPQAVAALESGFTVYVEKPPFLSIDDYNMILQAVRATKLDVVVGLQRRFEPPYQYLIDFAAKSGGLSAIRSRFVSGFRPTGWRLGDVGEGGVVLDLGFHHFDLVAASLVSSFGSTLPVNDIEIVRSDGGSDDAVRAAVGSMICGAVLVTFDLSYIAPSGYVDEELEIVSATGGRAGTLRKQRHNDGTPPKVYVLNGDRFDFVRPQEDNGGTTLDSRHRADRPLGLMLEMMIEGNSLEAHTTNVLQLEQTAVLIDAISRAVAHE